MLAGKLSRTAGNLRCLVGFSTGALTRGDGGGGGGGGGFIHFLFVCLFLFLFWWGGGGDGVGGGGGCASLLQTAVRCVVGCSEGHMVRGVTVPQTSTQQRSVDGTTLSRVFCKAFCREKWRTNFVNTSRSHLICLCSVS